MSSICSDGLTVLKEIKYVYGGASSGSYTLTADYPYLLCQLGGYNVGANASFTFSESVDIVYTFDSHSGYPSGGDPRDCGTRLYLLKDVKSGLVISYRYFYNHGIIASIG